MQQESPHKNIILTLLALFLAVFLFILDTLAPSGLAIGLNYILVILLISFTKNRKLIILFSLLSILLIVAGIFTSISDGSHHKTYITNQILSILFVAIIGLMSIQETISIKILEEFKKIRTLFDACPTPLILISNMGTIEMINNAAKLLFAYNNDDRLDCNISSLIPSFFPDKSNQESLQEAINASYNKNLIGIKKDNSVFNIAVDSRTIENQQTILSVRDTTEQLKREVENKALTDVLKSSNADLNDFAYIVSHDLKQPLRGISSLCIILRDKYAEKLDEEAKLKLEKLPVLSKKLDKLIDNILAYSRARKKELNITPIYLNKLLKEVTENLEYQIQESHTKIQIDKDLPVVYADKTCMFEVFSNLISNAIKYNDKDVPMIEIGTQFDPNKQDKIAIYIKDNGIGIDEKHIENIFGLFKRISPDPKYGEGNGVGLAIVKQMIEKHHGTINAESQPNIGSIFYITLPRGASWQN